jgi:hypothetical protein
MAIEAVKRLKVSLDSNISSDTTQSTNISTADSKAVSVGLALSTANSKITSAHP